MPGELGKIEKPTVEEYKSERKLYFVPLVFSAPKPEAGLQEIVDRYWDQVEAQIANLEAKFGRVSKVYHEMVPVGGEDGVKVIEELCKGSYQVARVTFDKGAELLPIEDGDLLTEFMDWNRCLLVGLQNQNVFAKVYEYYIETQTRRNEHVAQQIDETLKSGDPGILFFREGHQVQFPPDIQVLYIAPPALDEIRRWLKERETEDAEEGGAASPDEPS